MSNPEPRDRWSEFGKELEHLINRYSIDNELETPDFILAENIVGYLGNLQKTNLKREKWFGRESKMFFTDKIGPLKEPSENNSN